MTRPFFSQERISHFNIFDRHAEDAIMRMKSRFRAGHPVDFQASKAIVTILCTFTTKNVGSCVTVHARLCHGIYVRELRA
jgi:hypothetical protein